jgi:hypothetical protein
MLTDVEQNIFDEASANSEASTYTVEHENGK